MATDWAGIAAAITATGGLVAALRNNRQITATKAEVVNTKQAVATTQSTVEDVHKIVNGRSDRQDDRIEQLGEALDAAGVDIPPHHPQPETPA